MSRRETAAGKGCMVQEEDMKRILIFGNSGAGKTTLALKLGETLGMPVFHLDQLWWLSGWEHDSRENFDRKLAEILKRECWIIDGEYTRTLPERLKFADTAIYLDFSSIRCFRRVLKRIFTWYGRSRPDMPSGCPERLDWAFLCYVWNFRRRFRPVIEVAFNDCHGNVIRLKTPGEAERFLRDAIEKVPGR